LANDEIPVIVRVDGYRAYSLNNNGLLIRPTKSIMLTHSSLSRRNRWADLREVRSRALVAALRGHRLCAARSPNAALNRFNSAALWATLDAATVARSVSPFSIAEAKDQRPPQRDRLSFTYAALTCLPRYDLGRLTN